MAVNSNHSIQVSYPLNPLPSSSQPVILQSIHGKSMVIDSIVIEKIGKSGTNQTHSGSIYLSSCPCPKKQPLEKYQFELEMGKKRFCVEFKKETACRYVFLQINQTENQNDLAFAEELAIVGVIGEEIEN